MEIADSNIYPHLAKFQMREAIKAEKIRIDRELEEEFGKTEEEEIWRAERVMS